MYCSLKGLHIEAFNMQCRMTAQNIERKVSYYISYCPRCEIFIHTLCLYYNYSRSFSRAQSLPTGMLPLNSLICCLSCFPGWVFFIYLVTTGWIFEIRLCENSINHQSIRAYLEQPPRETTYEKQKKG